VGDIGRGCIGIGIRCISVGDIGRECIGIGIMRGGPSDLPPVQVDR